MTVTLCLIATSRQHAWQQHWSCEHALLLLLLGPFSMP